MDKQYDFSGWASKSNLKCSDGRTIMPGAFKHHDGETVPLVWMHQHDETSKILGHALLENRDEGLYAYCSFNETESGKEAKELVRHGDVKELSIWANKLQQNKGNVLHGIIREVSLVLAGANPGAKIENVVVHSADGDVFVDEEEAYIFTGEKIELYHADNENDGKTDKNEDKPAEDKDTSDDNETLQDVYDSMPEKYKTLTHIMIEAAVEDVKKELNHSEGENEDMKKNVFDTKDQVTEKDVLSHADEMRIIEDAKKSSVGSLRAAIDMYKQEKGDSLAHAFEKMDELFPEYKLVKPGAPELLERDQDWVSVVMSKVHKSPVSRIRTRQADARANELRAKGYNNRAEEKKISGQIKLLTRTTDPQTVYRKDEMHRDDITDITDFEVVGYNWNVLNRNLKEEIALATLIGDGRADGDPDKIYEDHIRSIWHDEELYTIHADVDLAKYKKELQGTNTGANFGENYLYSEAIIQSALYAREKYKGSGSLDFFCTPHLLNIMLLARDLNGRRIYSSKNDLVAALNVNNIYTIEQFEGKTRTTDDNQVKKLLGIFVNLGDYQYGCTKGGEITKFEQFDIDFNKYKYLIETRLSGALTKVYSAIALEEPVVAEEEDEGNEAEG